MPLNDSTTDGVPDADDVFPSMEICDTDGDGIGDNSDAFPNDSSVTDSDGDGIGNNADAFPQWKWMRLMFIGNNSDSFPQEQMKQSGSDGELVNNTEKPMIDVRTPHHSQL